MRLSPLDALTSRRFVVTTHSNHARPIAENLLDRAFWVETPKARWTADSTSVHPGEGWLYLAVLLDLFSRRVVGWARGETLERRLVLWALDRAVTGRQPAAGLLCHSDRGRQYARGDSQKALQQAGATCRLSRRHKSKQAPLCPSPSAVAIAGTMRRPRVSLRRSSASWFIALTLPHGRQRAVPFSVGSKSGTIANAAPLRWATSVPKRSSDNININSSSRDLWLPNYLSTNMGEDHFWIRLIRRVFLLTKRVRLRVRSRRARCFWGGMKEGRTKPCCKS